MLSAVLAVKDGKEVDPPLPRRPSRRRHSLSFLQVLTEELPALIAGLNFKRSMRWNGKAAFSRPLRWLLALHGSTVLPFVYAGLRAGGKTRLLRTSTTTHNECQVSSCEATPHLVCCDSKPASGTLGTPMSGCGALDRALCSVSSWRYKQLTRLTVTGWCFLNILGCM